jgi:hypothetical protein
MAYSISTEPGDSSQDGGSRHTYKGRKNVLETDLLN